MVIDVVSSRLLFNLCYLICSTCQRENVRLNTFLSYLCSKWHWFFKLEARTLGTGEALKVSKSRNVHNSWDYAQSLISVTLFCNTVFTTSTFPGPLLRLFGLLSHPNPNTKGEVPGSRVFLHSIKCPKLLQQVDDSLRATFKAMSLISTFLWCCLLCSTRWFCNGVGSIKS